MSARLTALLVVVVAAIAAVLSSAFIVYPSNQALVLQFGQVKRAITEPGLYFKLPLVQNVEYLDRRILDLELENQEVIAADQKRLIVSAFARYRIVDPVQFYQTVRTVPGGRSRLNTFVTSGLRAVIADATFADVVRDKRDALVGDLRKQVDQQARGFGIEVVDVRIRRADLPPQNSTAVFQRMQTERQREAAELRARGAEESQRIRAKARAEREIILAEANRDADRMRGEGEALRSKIFADAIGKDPEFYAFYRSLQAYESSFKSNDTRIIMSPNSEFFRFFDGPKPAAPAAPAIAPKPAP